jgi:hypothetical protein
MFPQYSEISLPALSMLVGRTETVTNEYKQGMPHRTWILRIWQFKWEGGRESQSFILKNITSELW